MSKGKNEKIFKAQQWLGILHSSIKFRSNKYQVVRGLWKGVAVQQILYGANVINWTTEEIRSLDTIQNKVGRIGLGANYYVAVEGIRGEMGWSKFEERIDKGTLNYKKGWN